MGITIHLQGRLREVSDVSRLVEELSDIAETLRWGYEVIGDQDLRGISVTPHPECEPLALIFDHEGILRNPILPRDEMNRWVAVKTQYAPVDVHMCLIKLIRHLERRYFAELQVRDEGEYWESGDRGRLLALRRRLRAALEDVSHALEDALPPPVDAKAEDIVAKLEDVIAHLEGKDESHEDGDGDGEVGLR